MGSLSPLVETVDATQLALHHAAAQIANKRSGRLVGGCAHCRTRPEFDVSTVSRDEPSAPQIRRTC